MMRNCSSQLPMKSQYDLVYATVATIQHDNGLSCTARATFSKSAKFLLRYQNWVVLTSFPLNLRAKSRGSRLISEMLLMQELLPVIYNTAGNIFVFQQVNAPTHRARDIFELLRCETPHPLTLICGLLLAVLRHIQCIVVSEV